MTKKMMAVSFFVVFALVIAFSSAVSAQSTAEKLIGSWNVEVMIGNLRESIVTSFSIVNGELKGELVSSSLGTSILGPLKNLKVTDNRISFTTPTGADYELRFYKNNKNSLFGTVSYRNYSGIADFKRVPEKK